MSESGFTGLFVDDSDGVDEHKRVDTLTWTQTEQRQGKLVHIKKFPKGHQVKLFRIVSGSGRTAYIVTNDLSQSDTQAAKQDCRVRWKIEQLRRELKQTTGISKCRSRRHRGQWNHIACCLWVWVSLTRAARATGQTIDRLKESLYDDYNTTRDRKFLYCRQLCVSPKKFDSSANFPARSATN